MDCPPNSIEKVSNELLLLYGSALRLNRNVGSVRMHLTRKAAVNGYATKKSTLRREKTNFTAIARALDSHSKMYHSNRVQ